MNDNPVIKSVANCLMHTPDLLQHGSKPRRETSAGAANRAHESDLLAQIRSHLRSYSSAVLYPPNQTFIGNTEPDELARIERPWYRIQGSAEAALEAAAGPFGEIMPQQAFYCLLKAADILEPPLFEIAEPALASFRRSCPFHQLLPGFSPESFAASPLEAVRSKVGAGEALGIYTEQELVGCFNRDNRAEGRDDENLMAQHLLENLCTKASGAYALRRLIQRAGLSPDGIDFILSCGEEACGDRYQRGGGGMAKAMGEMCGCGNASGLDVKNFCAAPASAVILAATMVKSGLYSNIAVVGGGSLAKLGMKFKGFLQHDMPILDDCLASIAILVSGDDGRSPVVRLEQGAVGKATIGSSTSDENVYRDIILKPLQALQLTMADVDRFAPELQNPEIMEFAGSGDVARKNYSKITAMATLSGHLPRERMKSFFNSVGMPGFAPTQGHIPSAVPYLAHALTDMQRDRIRRAMFVGKASLFLGRCTQLYDGVSFILEKNPQTAGKDTHDRR